MTKSIRMTNPTLTSRLAQPSDLTASRELMEAAISELQQAFLTPEQIAASRAIMGLETQLIEDGTYFIVKRDGMLARILGTVVCDTPANTCSPLIFGLPLGSSSALQWELSASSVPLT